MLISSIHFWCKIRMQLFLSLVLFHSVVFSLSSNYKCFLIASLPSGLLRSLFEICRLISTSLAKSPQWLGLDFNVLATERQRERENWENWWCWGTGLCTSTLKSAHLFIDEMQQDTLSPLRSSLTPPCNSGVIKIIRFSDYFRYFMEIISRDYSI